jgi:acetyl esterase/lipase
MSVLASFDGVGDLPCEPIEVIESGPSAAARMVVDATRATVYPALAVGVRAIQLPWPFGVLDRAAHMLPAPWGMSRASVKLPHAHAELIRARGVARRTGRVVLYCHGGGFVCCGINTHLRLIERLSHFADAPILAVNYRMLPRHTIREAVDDCRDAYRWLRGQGYSDDQIVVAGDSAGGYLALTLAQELFGDGEVPAALTLMSPLLQLASERPRRRGPMLPHKAFAALTDLIVAHEESLYEPLDNVEPGLPPTLIHVSGCEELVYDAQLAVRKLVAVGVPAQLRIWPGQIHVFQIAAPVVPEATRSLRQVGRYVREAVA